MPETLYHSLNQVLFTSSMVSDFENTEHIAVLFSQGSISYIYDLQLFFPQYWKQTNLKSTLYSGSAIIFFW